MRRRSLIQGLGLLLLLLAGSARAEKINTTLFGHLAVQGYDVVAYQAEQRAVEGSRDYAYDWHGATWLFANDAHRKAFIAMPERFAPQYGGYCAYAVGAKNDLVGIDPQAFTIVDGKLYLNYSKDVQAKWNADRAALIEKADRNWPALNK